MAANPKSLRERLAGWIGGEIVREAVATADEYQARLTEAYGTTVDADDDDWRKLTGDAQRDLSPMTQRRMQKLGLYLWESNLLANRIIELPIAYLLAEGCRLQAADEIVQEWIDRFWDDPINSMDLKLVRKVRELAIYGEQCWPAFVNQHNGHVRLGYLDPALIETVVTDPDNGEQPIGIVTCKDRKGIARRYRVIVNGPEAELFTQRTQAIRETFTDGECFYFTVNSLSNGRRGRSDLLAQIDWLDGYDQFLFGELDRNQFLRAWMWDVKISNATPDEVEQRATKIRAPQPGSVRVHNDAEEWTAVSPNLQSADSSEAARLFRNHVLGGASLPEVWYGGGGDVNRAAASEMGGPTFKMFSMRQTYIGYILVCVGQYVIRQRELAHNGREPELFDPAYGLEVQWPEMVASDTTKYAAALQQVTVATAMLIGEGLITRARGLQIIVAIAGRLGVEFDADEELAAVEQEAKDRAKDDAFSDPPEPESEPELTGAEDG